MEKLADVIVSNPLYCMVMVTIKWKIMFLLLILDKSFKEKFCY